METEQILKGNALIAAFMGGEYRRTPDYFEPSKFHEQYNFNGPQGDYRTYTGSVKHHYLIRQLNYHAQWDWIMPVYDKIRGIIALLFKHEMKRFDFAWKSIRQALFHANIKVLWREITYFIISYNDHTNGKAKA